MKRVTLADFPGAPPDAYLDGEWLILRGEAFTVEEWPAHIKRVERGRHRNSERRRETRRRWMAANIEKMRAYQREYKRQHKYRSMSLAELDAGIARWRSIVAGMEAEKKRRVMAELRQGRAA